jgi:ATP-dependent DNA helicase DinG
MTGGPSSIDRYLTGRARLGLAEAIEEAGGNEVFFVGRPGPTGVIDEVEVLCRGHKSAVPALQQAGQPGDVVVHNHPSGRLIPSEPDLALASHFGQEGVGFFIVDNVAEAIYVVVEPMADKVLRVEPEAVETAFTARGALPDLIEGYEPRPGQVDMGKAVAAAQNDGRLLVVEAGTGTGKSIAYLLPSAMRALGGGERVAVATRTRHLQQQLMDREVPLLRRLHPDLGVAILKGRGNYLCLRKLHDRLADLGAATEPDPAEREFLFEIRDWARATRRGDLDDLSFVPDRSMWEMVESSTEHTLRVRCPHYEECFYYGSRKRAARANILLVNHHLLLADLALRREGVPGGLLPKYEHVVLDEAHHLEDVATDFAGRDVSAWSLLQQLGRIRPVRGRRRGLAVRLERAIQEEELNDDAARLLEAVMALLQETEACRAQLRLHLEDVGEAVWEASGGGDDDRAPDERRSRTWRLDDDLEKKRPALFELLTDRLQALAGGLVGVAKKVHSVREILADMPDAFARAHLQVGMDLRTVQRRLTEAATALGAMLVPDGDVVRWIEVSRGRDRMPQPRFKLRPVEVGELVRATVASQPRSVVMTSATLSVAGKFDHFVKRTGLDEEDTFARVDTLQIPSPFDYSEQVFCAVPSDLPDPRSGGYIDAVCGAVTEAIRIADGRTFVLFTSYRMLGQVANEVRRRLGKGWTILRQGDLPRDRLLDLFRQGTRTTLFGTDSFWEGVDVRGRALSCVVLPKLPFRVPTEPVQQARAERVEAAGGDSFRELSVPQAVLKFRQGFGRLIRHRSDRGVVLVLDTRTIRMGYGRRFLRSLPSGMAIVRNPLEDVLRRMKGFLEEESG